MKFKLHWLSGKPQIVCGDDIASAMNNAGIEMGALPALDYWEEIEDDNDTEGGMIIMKTEGYKGCKSWACERCKYYQKYLTISSMHDICWNRGCFFEENRSENLLTKSMMGGR